MITRFYLPLLSTNVKHPKFRCHVTTLCQGLCRSAGCEGEDPENQVEVEQMYGLMYGFNVWFNHELNHGTIASKEPIIFN